MTRHMRILHRSLTMWLLISGLSHVTSGSLIRHEKAHDKAHENTAQISNNVISHQWTVTCDLQQKKAKKCSILLIRPCSGARQRRCMAEHGSPRGSIRHTCRLHNIRTNMQASQHKDKHAGFTKVRQTCRLHNTRTIMQASQGLTSYAGFTIVGQHACFTS